MTLQQFLANRDVSLTLINSHDEAVYLGEAVTVKPLKNKHYLRFESSGLPTSIFPYDRALLHSGRRIFSLIDITPIRITDSTSVELIF